MIEIIKFIIITTISIFAINLINKLDKDFNRMSCAYGLIIGSLIWILYDIF